MHNKSKTIDGIPDYPWKDFILLYGVFFVLVYVFYFLPNSIRYLTTFTLLLLFAISKRDYWWFALFFMIYSGPWGLFTEGTREAASGIPLISFGPGLSFTFKQLFLFVAIAKAIYLKRRVQLIFKNQFIILFLFFGLLVVLSFFYRSSLSVIIDDLKSAVFWGFIFVFPALIRFRDHTYYFIFLILPIVILVFFDAIFFLSTGGQYIGDIIHLNIRTLSLGIDSTINKRFMLPGWHAVLIGFILSLSLAQIDKKHSLFHYTIAAIAFIIVIVSATRSWFIIFSLIIIYTLYRVRQFRTLIFMGSLFMIFFWVILSQPGNTSTMFGGSMTRILTVFDISDKGSLSNQAIENKVEFRLPAQLEYIKMNPITGWGFTEKKGDMDVGVFGHLVEMGVIGVSIFIWLWYSYLSITYRLGRSKRLNINFCNTFAVFWISMIGLLISHFTTNQIFGITYYTVFVTMLFWLTDFFIKEGTKSIKNGEV